MRIPSRALGRRKGPRFGNAECLLSPTGARRADCLLPAPTLTASDVLAVSRGMESGQCCERAFRPALCIDVDLLEIVAIHGLGPAGVPDLPSLAYVFCRRLRNIWLCARCDDLAESGPCFAIRLPMPRLPSAAIRPGWEWLLERPVARSNVQQMRTRFDSVVTLPMSALGSLAERQLLPASSQDRTDSNRPRSRHSLAMNLRQESGVPLRPANARNVGGGIRFRQARQSLVLGCSYQETRR